MSQQHHDLPVPPPVPSAPAPGPAAAVRLRARIAESRRALQWLPTWERDWRHAMETAAATYDLTPVHHTIRQWEHRLRTEPLVDELLAEIGAGGPVDTGTDTVALDELIGPRR